MYDTRGVYVAAGARAPARRNRDCANDQVALWQPNQTKLKRAEHGVEGVYNTCGVWMQAHVGRQGRSRDCESYHDVPERTAGPRPP